VYSIISQDLYEISGNMDNNELVRLNAVKSLLKINDYNFKLLEITGTISFYRNYREAMRQSNDLVSGS
jgi:hypothetical protein